MEIKKYTLGYDVNTYLIISGKHAIVIDPGYLFDSVLAKLDESGIALDFVLLTHLHFDHTFGLKDIKDTDIYFSVLDKDNLYNQDITLYKMIGKNIPYNIKKENIHYLNDGEIITFNDNQIKVIFTPGHTSGSLCYLLNDNYLFSGDTLFKQGVGRTDLPSGNVNDLKKSLAKLAKLSRKVRVLPGHDENTTIEEELRFNPYLKNLV